MIKKITKRLTGAAGLALLCIISVIAVQKPAKAQTVIPIGSTWTSATHNEGDSDNLHQYQFTIPSDGKVTVTCQSSVTTNNSWAIYLQNKDCTEVYDSEKYNHSEASLSEYLKAGTYGIQFEPYYSSDTVSYKIKVEFQPVSCNVPEPNNDFVSATPISLNQLKQGLLTQTNKEDYFKVQLSKATTLKVVTTGEGYRYVSLYDKDFVRIQYFSTSVSGSRVLEEYVSPGTYYIQVERSNSTPYTLKCVAQQYVTGIQLRSSLTAITKGKTANLLSSVTPSDATQKTLKWSTSDSSVATVSSTGKVTARAVGYAYITAVTTDGTNISRQATVVVKPGKAALKKLKLYKYDKRQISIKAKAQKNVTYYQYQYAKNKKFKKAKSLRSSNAAVTTKRLSKKKKYYVRVRAYYTYNGKNYYGAWSKAKSIRTKK